MVTPLPVIPDGDTGTEVANLAFRPETAATSGQQEHADTRRDLGSLPRPCGVKGFAAAALEVLHGFFPAVRAEHEDAGLRILGRLAWPVSLHALGVCDHRLAPALGVTHRRLPQQVLRPRTGSRGCCSRSPTAG